MSDTMTMPSLLTSQYPAAQPRQQDFSLQQTALQARQTEITMTTSEGDRVTLSSSMENLQAMQYDATGAGQNISFVAASLGTANFSMTVEGDLNAQELADISSLIKDLSHIAKDFFKGHLEQAMNKGLNIGDTGTINAFSADFSSTSITTSRLTGNHPISALSQETMGADATTEASANVASDLPGFMDLLRGQWAQLEEIFQQQQAAPAFEFPVTSQELPDTAPAATTPAEIAQAMMAKAATTMADNPRLSPLIQPLADRVIDNSAADLPKFPGAHGLANRLHTAFAQALHLWLTAV